MFKIVGYEIEMTLSAVCFPTFSAVRTDTLTYDVYKNETYHGLCFPTINQSVHGNFIPTCMCLGSTFVNIFMGLLHVYGFMFRNFYFCHECFVCHTYPHSISNNCACY